MARSARRPAIFNSNAGRFAVVLLLLGAALHTWAARPVGLRGIELDRDVAIESISGPAPIGVGDEVVALDGAPIQSPEAAALAMLSAGNGSVEARIRRQSYETTVLLTPERLLTDPPVELQQQYTVVQLGDQQVSGTIGLDELLYWAEDTAPTPLEVTLDLEGQTVAGTLAVVRRPPAIPGMLVIGLALLAVLGLTVLRDEYLELRGVSFSYDVTAATLGGLALAGLLAATLTPWISPRYVAWTMVLALLWRGASASLHRSLGREREAPSPSAMLLHYGPGAVALLAVLALLGTSVGLEAPEAWVEQAQQLGLACAILIAIIHVVEMIRYGRAAHEPGYGPWFGLVGGTIAIAAGVAFAFNDPWLMARQGHVWVVLGVVACQWVGDYFAAVPATTRPRQDLDNEGVVPTLRKLSEAVSGRRIAIAAGFGSEFVAVEEIDPAGDGELRLDSRLLRSEVSSALSMLETEGGMYPRHEHIRGADAVEEDPFADLMEKVGLAAALPITAPEGSALVVYAVAFVSDEDDTLEIDALAEAVHGVGTVLFDELNGMVAAQMLNAARRADQERRKKAVEGATTPSPMPMREVEHAPNPSTLEWIEHLEKHVAREYPIEEPEVLSEEEWDALHRLASADGAVLVIGEPGVGKELIARALHRISPRASERIGVLDCSVVPGSLVHIELFGDEMSPGLVDALEGGTVVLKSASNLDRPLLEEVVERLRGSSASTVFIERFSGSSGGIPESIPEPIREAVGKRFLHLSPLRERPEDIVRYAKFFLHQLAMRYDRVVMGFSDEALRTLRGMTLPSNFVDLQAVVRDAVLRSEGTTIELGHVESTSIAPRSVIPPPSEDTAPAAIPGPSRSAQLVLDEEFRDEADEEGDDEVSTSRPANVSQEALSLEGDDDERAVLLEALERADGNKSEAARLLNVSRGRFLRRLRKYDLM